MKLDVLPDLVNNNAALVRRGRYLTTTFMLEIGPEQFMIRVRNGRIIDVAPSGVMPSWSFCLRAPEEVWKKFWAGIPEPGYNDIFALIRRGLMRLEGDLQPLMANLLYIKEVLASIRMPEVK
jgi:hypothetical protein